MKRQLKEYLTRGGTLTAIANCWGVSLPYVSKLAQKDADYWVEFNVFNPSRVQKFWIPGRQVVIKEKVFFEAKENEE